MWRLLIILVTNIIISEGWNFSYPSSISNHGRCIFGRSPPSTRQSVLLAARCTPHHRISRRSLLFIATPLSLSLSLTIPFSASAERTLGTLTTSYNRNIPRMQDGFLLLTSLDLTDVAQQTAIIKEIDEERGTTVSAMTATMRIFSTAFSDSVLTKTTRELQLATVKTRSELNLMSSSLKSGEIQDAQKHLDQALFFIDVYVTLANSSLPRVMKVTGPKGESQKFDAETVKSEGAF